MRWESIEIKSAAGWRRSETFVLYFFSTPVRQHKKSDYSWFTRRSIVHLRGKWCWKYESGTSLSHYINVNSQTFRI